MGDLTASHSGALVDLLGHGQPGFQRHFPSKLLNDLTDPEYPRYQHYQKFNESAPLFHCKEYFLLGLFLAPKAVK